MYAVDFGSASEAALRRLDRGNRLAFERARIHTVWVMNTTSGTRTWIITGATSGLGLALAEAALQRGERVLGTARRVDRFDAMRARYGDRLIAVEHDVRDTEGAAAVVQRAIDAFGRIDVLVNNAGAGQVGAAEEVTDGELRDMLEQHLFGPAAYVRAALPHMRDNGSGAIVQMSSQGGRMSFPAVGSYSAGKFALEGWSEALAGEVAPFGIRVLIVEPSRFRTEFNATGVLRAARQHAGYDEVIGAVRANMAEADGIQEGDPDSAAAAIRQDARCRGRATATAPRRRSGPQPHPRLPARAGRSPAMGRREQVSGLPRYAASGACVLSRRTMAPMATEALVDRLLVRRRRRIDVGDRCGARPAGRLHDRRVGDADEHR